ncbi:unnamed protein product [Gordionus sp. m RMFG-2023]|uniref:uncharacterized protein LOC135930136 n=1 Tax=Gordionus sp. m RMFG-2023 TaxID=3053472 RepID=UPI0030DF80EF
MLGATRFDYSRSRVLLIIHIFVISVMVEIKGISLIDQSFAIKPVDTLTRLGQDVLLPCVINNRVGKVQWTKNAVALGSNREIPRFPTYSMVGREEDGNFSLLVKNVSLTDEAIYECQVLPVKMISDTGLRAKAKLSIAILPFKNPEISVYRNKESQPFIILSSSFDDRSSMVTKAALMMHINVTKADTLNLRCSVWGGKPSSLITWFKKNQKNHTVRLRNVSAQYLKSNYNVVYNDIRVHPTNLDNGSSFTCIVNPPGFPLDTYPHLSIHLNVLSKPTHAKIMITEISNVTNDRLIRSEFDYNNYENREELEYMKDAKFVAKGNNVVLKCIVFGGNPMPLVNWYKNGVKQLLNHNTQLRDNVWESNYSFVASEKDDNTTYRCIAANNLDQGKVEAQTRIYVSYPPEHLTLKKVEGDFMRNQSSYVMCLTSANNPPHKIRWHSNALNFTVDSNLEIIRDVSNDGFNMLNLTQFNDKWTYSISTPYVYAKNLKYGNEINPFSDDKVGYGHMTWSILKLGPFDLNATFFDISCIAINPMSQQNISTIKLYDIFDFPKGFGIMLIKPSYNALSIPENQTAVLKCAIYDDLNGSDMYWKIKDKIIKVPIEYDKKGRANIKYTFKAKRNHMKNSIQCIYKHKFADINTRISYRPNITFDANQIELLPTLVEAKVHQLKKFTCRVSESNPEPTLIWFLENNPLPNVSVISTQIIEDKKSFVKITLSVLEMEVDQTLHEKIVTCQAISKTTKNSIYASAKILILTLPLFKLNMAGAQVVKLYETSNFSQVLISIDSFGYPPDIKSFECYKEEITGILKNSNLSLFLDTTSKQLKLNKVDYTDVGAYKCLISNLAGNTWVKLNLELMKPIRISTSHTELEVDNGGLATMRCLVYYHNRGSIDSSTTPNNNDYDVQMRPNITKWVYDGKTLTEDNDPNLIMFKGKDFMELQIKRVNPKTAGKYGCIFEDKFGQVLANIKLKIKYAPIFSLNNIKIVAPDLTDSVNLNCQAYGYPKVLVDWILEGKRVTTNNRIKGILITNSYSMENFTALSKISLSKVSSKYLNTTIQCVAYNDLGRDFQNIFIAKRGKPYPVRKINLTRLSPYSVNIKWEKPFDGGLPTNFSVGVRMIEELDNIQNSILSRNLVQRSNHDTGDKDTHLFEWHNVYSSDNIQTYEIFNLKRDFKYVICVMGTNDIGTSGCQNSSSMLYFQNIYDNDLDRINQSYYNSTTMLKRVKITPYTRSTVNLFAIEDVSHSLVMILICVFVAVVLICHISIIVHCRRKKGGFCKGVSQCRNAQCKRKHNSRYDNINTENGSKFILNYKIDDDDDLFRGSKSLFNGSKTEDCSNHPLNKGILQHNPDMVNEGITISSPIKPGDQQISYETKSELIDSDNLYQQQNYAEILRQNAKKMNKINDCYDKLNVINPMQHSTSTFEYQSPAYCDERFCELENLKPVNATISDLRSSIALKEYYSNDRNLLCPDDISKYFARPNFIEWKQKSPQLSPNNLFEQYSNLSSDSGNGSIPSPLILNSEEPLNVRQGPPQIDKIKNENKLSITTVIHNYIGRKPSPAMGHSLREQEIIKNESLKAQKFPVENNIYQMSLNSQGNEENFYPPGKSSILTPVGSSHSTGKCFGIDLENNNNTAKYDNSSSNDILPTNYYRGNCEFGNMDTSLIRLPLKTLQPRGFKGTNGNNYFFAAESKRDNNYKTPSDALKNFDYPKYSRDSPNNFEYSFLQEGIEGSIKTLNSGIDI